MMTDCWLYRPDHRTTFESIITRLTSYLSQRFHKESYFFNRPSLASSVKEETTQDGGPSTSNLPTTTANAADKMKEDIPLVGMSVFDLSFPLILAGQQPEARDRPVDLDPIESLQRSHRKASVDLNHFMMRTIRKLSKPDDRRRSDNI